MRNDDLADRVGVDNANEEDERDKVVVENYWLEVQVAGDDDPGDEAGNETEKR